jgi:hypothetical protein
MEAMNNTDRPVSWLSVLADSALDPGGRCFSGPRSGQRGWFAIAGRELCL